MNILITGASSGIGYATALEFASNSHTVIAIARQQAKLDELKAEAEANKLKGKIIVLCQDITAIEINNFQELIQSHVNHIDILINNAGYLVNHNFFDTILSDWEEVFSVNLFSVVKLTHALRPLLGGNHLSHIVNIGSMGGFQGTQKFPGLSAYSASKAALANLTETMAEEFKDINIKVNCLSIGSVQTEMLQKAFPGYQAPVISKTMAEFISDFGINGHKVMNGKIIPVSVNTP